MVEKGGRTTMKKLLVGFLMFGLIFGTAAVMKAADFDGIHIGKDYGYNRDRDYGRSDRDYTSFGDFRSWEASQRDRLNDAYRDNAITRFEFNKLNRELSRIDGYHDQVADKGWISDRERDRLGRMEARFNSDLDREMGEHTD
jgi:hypothetical protein